MDYGLLQGIWTVVALAIFLGVCVWAWSSRRKREFEEASRIPFAEDEAGTRNE